MNKLSSLYDDKGILEIQSSKAEEFIKNTIDYAINNRASDIHFEPYDKYILIRLRIDGELVFFKKINKNAYQNIVNIIKIKSECDTAIKFAPQDGRFSHGDVDLRVSFIDAIYGEKICIRILNNKEMFTIDNIGLSEKAKELFNKIVKYKYQMTIITGPTGSGKNSTMYTMLNNLDKKRLSIVSVEDPVEYRVNDIDQIEIHDYKDITFANTLRAILRQDPDVIAIGEIRDEESAQIAVRASLTGHKIITTLHSMSPVTSINRLLEMDVEASYLFTSLNAIINQRLVKRLKSSYEDIDFEDDGDKYFGRIAVFEIMLINDKIRDLLLKNNTKLSSEIYNEMKKLSDYVSFEDSINYLLEHKFIDEKTYEEFKEGDINEI
ncbi:GspE/PulE family protein [Fenollaria massiliensis]|uniref:Flp pilus assembly complex ATPase component TadA n=1 Tax=Fenollaria massiliensis TaxID=938288 RepID=A0A9E7DKP9_9FIRM|nr:ATPase, T2SS/T4P/T4SS family [Fenollaria massiliensis]UQK59758.1 Flp pilus assembly complex ATPase component TadA [Fenollaria massiliensis]